MNRKLIVTLLHKNIEELGMITDNFMEMEEYPSAIVHIARRKTEDIQLLLEQLASAQNEKPFLKTENPASDTKIEKIIEPEKKEAEINLAPEAKVAETIIELEAYPVIETQNHETTRVTENIEKVEVAPEKVDEIEEVETIISETTSEKADNMQESEVKLTIETKTTSEISEKTDAHERKISTEETRKTTIADKITNPSLSRNEAHIRTTDNSLSATIANKKITDIKTAISIGDRFRFQRELFRGNGEDMNKTLSYINQLATLEEVSSFLKSKYSWDEENEIAEDFYQIVRRKFL